LKNKKKAVYWYIIVYCLYLEDIVMTKRMVILMALIVGVAFSAFGQTGTESVENKVYVVMTSGTEYNNYNRILGAFQKAVVEAGFTLGDNTSPYILEISLVFTELKTPNNSSVFFRYDITANFIDKTTRQTLLPVYAISGRNGHVNSDGAYNINFREAERKIDQEYKGLLENSFPR
jgi:hypothetical protein